MLSNAVISPNHELLTYEGNAFETVDFDFDRAQLGKDTASSLASFPPAPPPEPGKWSFVSQERPGLDASGDTCRTFFHLQVQGDPKTPNEFHLLQLGDPGLNRVRRIEIKSDKAPLAVEIKTEWPPGREQRALGCHKRLESGGWFRGVVNHPIEIVVLPHSRMRTDVIAASAAPAPGREDMAFRSVQLGPVLARELTVRPIQEDGSVMTGTPRLHLRGYLGAALKVKDLAIGSRSITAGVSGKAWAQVDGQTVGLDLLDAAKDTPMIGAVLLLVNGALLEWLRRLFFASQQKVDVTKTAAPGSE